MTEKTFSLSYSSTVSFNAHKLNPSLHAGAYIGGILKAIERESQEGKKLNFVNEFKNGTIYKIDGVYYNSHEGLNYLWGSALDKLGIPSIVAVGAAMLYHKSAYDRDFKSGEMNKYQRIGPIVPPFPVDDSFKS